jgi:POT family proton-dependent oligopeptide transporter
MTGHQTEPLAAAPTNLVDVAPSMANSERAYPAGLSHLCAVEFLERSRFYGIRAILILFMVAPEAAGGLGLMDSMAAAGYGIYIGAVYLAAFLGGWLGDTWLGARGAVAAGAIVIALGHIQLAAATIGVTLLSAHGIPRGPMLAGGLATIVLGTGLFKPNIAALVGRLYKIGDTNRDQGFTRFYMAVNAGALAGGIVVGWITFRFGWA